MTRYCLIIVCFIIVFARLARAQQLSTGLKEDNYTIEKNNPENVDRFVVGLMLLNWNYNMVSGIDEAVGLGFQYDISDNINFSASGLYQLPLNYINADIAAKFSDNILHPWQQYQAGATFYFKNILDNKPVKIKFQRRRLKETEYRLPVDNLTKSGLRAGYGTMNMPVYSGAEFSLFKGFEGYRTNDPSKTKYKLTGSYASNLVIDYINAGFSFEQVRDFIISLNDPYEGRAEASYRRQFYLDMIYAPSLNYSNINVTKENYPIPSGTYNVNDFTENSRFGFRLGYTRFSYNQYNHESYEIGYMPGPRGMGWYILIKGGFSVSF